MKAVIFFSISMAAATIASFLVSTLTSPSNLVISCLLLHCSLSAAYVIPSLEDVKPAALAGAAKKRWAHFSRRQDTSSDNSTSEDLAGVVVTATKTATATAITDPTATAAIATSTGTAALDQSLVDPTSSNKGNSTKPGHCHHHHHKGSKPPKPPGGANSTLVARHHKGGNSTDPCNDSKPHKPKTPKGNNSTVTQPMKPAKPAGKAPVKGMDKMNPVALDTSTKAEKRARSNGLMIVPKAGPGNMLS